MAGVVLSHLGVKAVAVEVEAPLVGVNNIRHLLATLLLVMVSLDNHRQVLVVLQLSFIFHHLLVHLHRPLEFYLLHLLQLFVKFVEILVILVFGVIIVLTMHLLLTICLSLSLLCRLVKQIMLLGI